jgi:hypothetical protein
MQAWRRGVRTVLHVVEAETAVWFLCRSCGHAKLFQPRELMKAARRTTSLKEIERQARCRRCQAQRAAIVLQNNVRLLRD